jgi:hypothetical protein
MFNFSSTRRRADAAPVDAPVDQVFLAHYVEHDKVITLNAPSIAHAIHAARQHMHVFTQRPDVVARPLMYDDDRIAVIMYGADHEYTLNVIAMPLHMHDRMPEDVFAR